MSDDKKKRSSTDRARRIWLAGLGAYGRAFTETKEALKDVSGEASDVFDDLVQKGQMVEMAVSMKSKEALEKSGVSDLKMPDLKIDDRIAKMRERLKEATGFDSNDAPEAGLEDRVAALEAKLDLVLKQLNKPVRKTPVKKAAVKKPVPKKTTTRKTTVKKTD